MIVTTRGWLRQQWLQFALAAVAFIAVGVVLTLLFGSGNNDPSSQPGTVGSPEVTSTATATTAATATNDTPESSALPTPDDMGMYRGVTLEQAQAIVPFEIVMPEIVPDGLEEPGITVVELPPSATGVQPYRVEVWFELSGDESPGKSVQFIQMTPSAGDPEMPEAETTTSAIDGIEVNRTTGVNAGGNPLLAYWWERDGVGYQIIAAPEGALTPGLVQDLMLAILVPPGPTTEEQQALLERERAEIMTVPIPDSCAISTWAGPDFRVRRSDAAAYFIEGDGLTLGTTHGVLFAGENEITWLAGAPLTTAELLAGPGPIRAARVDGDRSVVELPILISGQLDPRTIRDDSVERAWSSTVSFPSEGCWEISVTLGVHVLDATVYVYPSE